MRLDRVRLHPVLRGVNLTYHRAWIQTLCCWCAIVALVTGCGPQASRGEPSGIEPLTALGNGNTPLAAWRFTTAETAGRLLAKQGETVTLMQASGARRPTEELTAALALRSVKKYDLAGRMASSMGRQTKLFEADGADPIFVTWLTIRLLGSDPAFPAGSMAAAVKQRMAGLTKRVAVGDAEAAGLYVLGREVLDLLGEKRQVSINTPNPCSRLASAGSAGDLVSASTWFEFASIAHQRCPAGSVALVLDLAVRRLASRDGAVGAGVAAELRSAGEVVKLAGKKPSSPAVCQVLLDERSSGGVRLVRDTMVYLVCVDAMMAAGEEPRFSNDVLSWLDLIVVTEGRLPDQQSLDAMGLLYETQVLQMLKFRPDVIEAARAGGITGNPNDQVNKAIVAFARGGLPSFEPEAAAPRDPSALGSRAMLLAASVLAGGRCPEKPELSFGAASTRSDRADIDTLFRMAVILKGWQKCRGKPSAPDASGSILKAAQAMERSLGIAGKNSDLLGIWKAEEIRCLLGGHSQFSETTMMQLLPDYSLKNPRFDLSLDTLYASVRLSEIVDGGCARAFWEVGRVS